LAGSVPSPNFIDPFPSVETVKSAYSNKQFATETYTAEMESDEALSFQNKTLADTLSYIDAENEQVEPSPAMLDEKDETQVTLST
jgi:hypothetical protein